MTPMALLQRCEERGEHWVATVYLPDPERWGLRLACMFSGTESYAKRVVTRLHAAGDLQESRCRSMTSGSAWRTGPRGPAASPRG